MSSRLTKECLSFDERPSTPPHVRKYRKSAYLEPGKRYQHYGIAEDLTTMKLDEKVYGASESVRSRDTAADLLHHAAMSDLQRMNAIKAEANYKYTQREPLGHGPARQTQLPSKFTQGEAFGVKTLSVNRDAAKALLFPTDFEGENDGSDLYKRSHNSFAPGEQRRRNYDWKVDPNETRFGRKGDTIALNGVSKNITEVLKGTADDYNDAPAVNLKNVEDFRNMGDRLGQTKNLGQCSASRSQDIVYGKPSGSKSISAADVIKGKYAPEDSAPDRDLGKSITPGFRNITEHGRSFGVPSIRTDIPHKDVAHRSLADSQNYGDDLPAQDLITPPAFSDMAIGPLAMAEIRPKQRVLQLFRRIGYDLDDRLADDIFYKASGGREETSINAFRDVLNDYILKKQLLVDSTRR